jgi:plasmid stabilization system protein ParE
VKPDIITLPSAEMDLAETRDWYDARRPGLADEFMGAVDEAMDTIATFPEGFRVIFEDVRRTRTGKFPYYIYYFIHEQMIIVFAVLHERRDPQTWINRL